MKIPFTSESPGNPVLEASRHKDQCFQQFGLVWRVNCVREGQIGKWKPN